MPSMKFRYTDVDGCMYGLVSNFGGGALLPIKTPWRFAVIKFTIDKHFNLLRDGSHPHVPCKCANAIYSQGCTPSLCCAILQSAKGCLEGSDEGDPYLVDVVIACGVCAASLARRSHRCLCFCDASSFY